MTSEFEREHMAWRKARVARLTARDGWLSLIGKFFLEPGVAVPVGSGAVEGVLVPASHAPAQLGRVELSDRRVVFTPIAPQGLSLQRAGSTAREPLSEPVTLQSDAHGPGDRVLFGELQFDVMERADSFAVRVRDVSRANAEFDGIDYYPLDPSWRVTARLEPYTPERAIDLVYESGIAEPHFAPGAAVFERDGIEYRVDPVYETGRKRLWLVFADPTNRDQTYGAGRFLYAPPPEDGRVVLDFNRAFNPPCAFSPFVACPLPPQENRLKLRIEAGEKRPRDHV